MSLRQYFRYIKNLDTDLHDFTTNLKNDNILIDYNSDKKLVQEFIELKQKHDDRIRDELTLRTSNIFAKIKSTIDLDRKSGRNRILDKSCYPRSLEERKQWL